MDNTGLSLLRIPIDKTMGGGFVTFLKFFWVLYLVSMIATMLHTAKEIVIDKNAGIKVFFID
jgi:hypothetical protein